jgi:hypothetical protein
MKEKIRRGLVSRAWLGPALVVTAAIGFAQPPTTTLDLTGVQGGSLAGVYTSPYYAEIGGSTVSTPVICDDFADDSFLGESWNAYITPLSQVPTSGTDSYLKWTGATVSGISQPLTQAQAYLTAALLSIDILTDAPGQYNAQVASFALWGLFDPTESWNQLNSYGLGSYVTAAQTLISQTASLALSEGTAALNGATATIYSFDSCIQCISPPPQEFIAVNMPEPSSVTILAADLLGIVGLVFFFRRRIVRN